MSKITAIKSAANFRSPRQSIGDIDADTAARVIASASDVAMVIDSHGIIRDVAVGDANIAMEGFADVISKRWVDTVTDDSRHKVEEMLSAAAKHGETSWREINHLGVQGSIPLRCTAVDAGKDGGLIAFGRDLRPTAQLQQRLLQAQQSMERDYLRLRQAEARYRVLFQIASEAVLIVDQTSKKIVEANPAAGNFLGQPYASLTGQGFARLFHPDTRDAALAMLSDSASVSQTEPVRVRLADGRDEVAASAALFRQSGITQVIVRLWPLGEARSPSEGESTAKLVQVLARMPDAFVVADEKLVILDANPAFLEMVQIASAEAARGEPLGRFIGRPGVDVSVLLANLREHGWVKNFATIVRTPYASQEDVQLSGVAVRDGRQTYYGFVLRSVQNDRQMPSASRHELPRSAEQLMQLVGRVSLREIVGETTDAIERMCIEAALKLTSDNRASAAEILGLSRQSLYSKLNRFGLSGNEPTATSD